MASGQSESGPASFAFTAVTNGGTAGTGIAFRIPLAAPPQRVAFSPNPACPASGSASPGTLCLYAGTTGNLGGASDSVRTYSEIGVANQNTADTQGFFLSLSTAETGYTYWLGSYTYTAP